MIVNSIEPKLLVNNSMDPNEQILHIDFAQYPNWLKSQKSGKFTNFYENDKHIEKTYFSLLSKVFPFAQQHIVSIMANNKDHCHLIEGNAYITAKGAIENIHQFEIGENIDLWQLGVAGGTRIIGPIMSNDNTFTFYPMLVDCNHLLLPSTIGSNNKKDFKKFKRRLSK